MTLPSIRHGGIRIPIGTDLMSYAWLCSCINSSLSVFALHPLYIDLEDLGTLSMDITQEITDLRKKLEQSTLDYEVCDIN